MQLITNNKRKKDRGNSRPVLQTQIAQYFTLCNILDQHKLVVPLIGCCTFLALICGQGPILSIRTEKQIFYMDLIVNKTTIQTLLSQSYTLTCKGTACLVLNCCLDRIESYRRRLMHKVDILKTQSTGYCQSNVVCFGQSCTGNMDYKYWNSTCPMPHCIYILEWRRSYGISVFQIILLVVQLFPKHISDELKQLFLCDAHLRGTCTCTFFLNNSNNQLIDWPISIDGLNETKPTLSK